MKNNLNLHKSLSYILFISFLLMGSHVYADQTVSFLANVHPDTSETVFTVQLDGQQISTAQLNDMIRPDGGHIFNVTSMHGFLLSSSIPTSSDYAVIFIGALKGRSVRGFGAGTISLNGPSTTQINFDPGLFAQLLSNESLVLQSQIQSNHMARIEVHGFVKKK